MGNHHVFIGIGHLAGIPGRRFGGRFVTVDIGGNMGGGGAGKHQTLKQRIAGQAVGPVQTGAGGFADGIQVFDIGAAMDIGYHATTGVMCRRYHRNRLAGDVDSQLQTALINSGEVLFDKVSRFVADIEEQAVGTDAFHLMVDGAGDDIPWCQFGAFIEALHKALAVGQQQLATFAAHRFGNQERLGLRVIQAGRVELVEFHIGDAATGAPGHGDAIAGSAVRVAGVQIHLAGATGGQYH